MAEIIRSTYCFLTAGTCLPGAVKRGLLRAVHSTLVLLPLAAAGCDVLWHPYIERFGFDCAENPQACQPDAACDPQADGCSPADNPDGSVNPALPVSCAQLKQQGNTMDMEYKLYLNGDSALPYMAYCYNMMNTPTEYLTLNAGGQSNASRFVAVVPVSTDYQRVRFDPKTQQIICDDQTFAQSRGATLYNGSPVNSVPFGVTVACVNGRISGQIDLSATPFAVPPSAMAITGSDPQTTQPTFSKNDQIVALNAQGNCGHLTPTPTVAFPFNQKSGLRLQLKYVKN